MSGTLFFAAAVAAGLLLLGAVAYSYLRPRPGQRASVTSLLGILGFALVASPNWTSISIKSEGLELSLIRELQARQLAILSELRGGEAIDRTTETLAPPAAPAPREAPSAPRGPVQPLPSDERAPTAGPRAVARTGESRVSPRRIQDLVSAFERGELLFSQLSDRELLALSQQVTSRMLRR